MKAVLFLLLFFLMIQFCSAQSNKGNSYHAERAGYWCISGGMLITGGIGLIIANNFRKERRIVEHSSRLGWYKGGAGIAALGFILEIVAIEHAYKGNVKLNISFKSTPSGVTLALKF